LRSLTLADLSRKEKLALDLFMNQGVTFTVYFENEGIERIFPFNIIPRIVQAAEWSHIESGIKQRLKALNLFIKDVYNDQRIIKERIVPADLIVSCPHYTREVAGIQVPHDIYVHIAGIDLIRDADGTYYVLEDNLRTPSGVSYMLEMRFSVMDYDLKNQADIPGWRNLLLCLSGYEMYLKRYRGGFQGKNVADMAILNPEFPQSVLYCLQRIDQIINALSHENIGGTPQPQKQIGRLHAKVQYLEMDGFSDAQLKAFLLDTKNDFFQLSNTLGKTYFAYQ